MDDGKDNAQESPRPDPAGDVSENKHFYLAEAYLRDHMSPPSEDERAKIQAAGRSAIKKHAEALKVLEEYDREV